MGLVEVGEQLSVPSDRDSLNRRPAGGHINTSASRASELLWPPLGLGCGLKMHGLSGLIVHIGARPIVDSDMGFRREDWGAAHGEA